MIPLSTYASGAFEFWCFSILLSLRFSFICMVQLRPFHFPSLFEQVNQSIDLGGTYVSGG